MTPYDRDDYWDDTPGPDTPPQVRRPVEVDREYSGLFHGSRVRAARAGIAIASQLFHGYGIDRRRAAHARDVDRGARRPVPVE